MGTLKIEAIRRKKVSEEVFEQMKGLITAGVWKPGDKIPSENELRSMFNVSRLSIRESLKKLASYNIIETHQGSGSFIRKFEDTNIFDGTMMSIYIHNIDENTIRDMMEFRNIIEAESVYLATERASEKDIEYLKTNYEKMLEARTDIRKFSDYDFDFHKFIAHMTKNTILIKCYSVIWDYLKEYFDKVVEKIGVEKGSFYHGKILEAMEAKDAKSAKKIMKEHLAATITGFFDKNKDIFTE